MPQRLASILALLAFVLCLVVGGFEVGNPFTTTVGRALAAMAGTYGVGLVVGLMVKRAIDENLTPKPEPAAPAVVPAPMTPAAPAVKSKARRGR